VKRNTRGRPKGSRNAPRQPVRKRGLPPAPPPDALQMLEMQALIDFHTAAHKRYFEQSEAHGRRARELVEQAKACIDQQPS
jgi:hypothetical protein